MAEDITEICDYVQAAAKAAAVLLPNDIWQFLVYNMARRRWRINAR